MNIAIILGHPNKKSFCAALAKSYEEGAKLAGHKVKTINVIDMKFNALEQVKIMEKDVKDAQETISWAKHLVFVFPNWWSTMPALMKGFFDRVFSSGFAFKYVSYLKWNKLLKGKSARVISTMGTPKMIYQCFMGNPIKRNMEATLKFCGIKPVKYTYVHSITKLNEDDRKKWLNKIKKIAMKK